MAAVIPQQKHLPKSPLDFVTDYDPQASDSVWVMWGKGEEVGRHLYIYFFKFGKGPTDMHSQMKSTNALEQRVRIILSSFPSPLGHQQVLAAY